MPTASSPPLQTFQPFLRHYRPDTIATPGAVRSEITACEAALGITLPASLRALLASQNGGYYDKGLLHLLGARRPFRHDDLAVWNQASGWKAQFEHCDLQACLFFADDAFGNQYGFLPGRAEPAVWRFDIQEGEFTEIAGSIPELLDQIFVEDGSWLLGADYLEAYRESGAPWHPGRHLAMITPGLLGGSMDPANLQPLEPWINLRLAGQVVTQVKPLPAGTVVRGFQIDTETWSVQLDFSRR